MSYFISTLQPSTEPTPLLRAGRINVDRGFLSRFGVKAQSASLEGFIRGPINNHAGITSDPLPPSRQAQLPIIIEAVDDD